MAKQNKQKHLFIMNNNLKIFVVCHSIESYTHFLNLNGLNGSKAEGITYLFVGTGYHSGTFKNKNSYICEDLPDNIEQHKTLLTYTAWYAIIKNNLADFNEFVGIFEYDCLFRNDVQLLDDKCEVNSIIGFAPRPTNEPLYLNAIPDFTALLSEGEIQKAKDKSVWNASTNCIISVSFLDMFVRWFGTFIPEILKYGNHPHFHERAINICAANMELDYKFFPQYIKHFEERSHKIEL
jgi:hypothetical protein